MRTLSACRKLLSWCVLSVFLACVVLAGCKSREGYRSEIERRGIPYSQEGFLKEVKSGNRDTAGLFLRAGIDINARDEDGCTALMLASEKGDLELVNLLIGNGADVNVRDADGYTALMYVAYRGDLEIARLLIKNKADVNAVDNDGWTALMYASVKGKRDVVELLKKSGARKGGGKER
jgi:ankyrin repeat protein